MHIAKARVVMCGTYGAYSCTPLRTLAAYVSNGQSSFSRYQLICITRSEGPGGASSHHPL
jgi:hypothetical protein